MTDTMAPGHRRSHLSVLNIKAASTRLLANEDEATKKIVMGQLATLDIDGDNLVQSPEVVQFTIGVCKDAQRSAQETFQKEQALGQSERRNWLLGLAVAVLLVFLGVTSVINFGTSSVAARNAQQTIVDGGRVLVTKDLRPVATLTNTIDIPLPAISFLQGTANFSTDTIRSIDFQSDDGLTNFYRNVIAVDVIAETAVKITTATGDSIHWDRRVSPDAIMISLQDGNTYTKHASCSKCSALNVVLTDTIREGLGAYEEQLGLSHQGRRLVNVCQASMISMSEDDINSLTQYYDEAKGGWPTEVDFDGDRVHVQNIKVIKRNTIENFDAHAKNGDFTAGYAFTECSGSAIASSITFSKWESDGSLWIGHLADLDDALLKNINGPLLLFDCSDEEFATIGCIVNEGCYADPDKGAQSCKEYCSNHLDDCTKKGWETVGLERDLASKNVEALDRDLDHSSGANDYGRRRRITPGRNEYARKRTFHSRRKMLMAKNCQRMRRYLKVRTPLEQTFWDREDVKDCWFSTYQLGLYADTHLAFVAFPLDTACPIIAADAGLSVEDLELARTGLPVLRKMVSIVDPKAILDEVLYFDHEMQLSEFAHAVDNARINRNKELPEDRGRKEMNGNYDILINNCATFILDTAKTLKLEYKEEATYSMIINFVAERLASNDHIAEVIFEKLGEENGKWTTMFLKLFRGKFGMMKELVRKYIENEEQHLDESSPAGIA